MKIEITYLEGQPIGYDIVTENIEDKNALAQVRDLTFFGLDETAIRYDGLKLHDPKAGKTVENLDRLKFIQKIHKNI